MLSTCLWISAAPVDLVGAFPVAKGSGALSTLSHLQRDPHTRLRQLDAGAPHYQLGRL